MEESKSNKAAKEPEFSSINVVDDYSKMEAVIDPLEDEPVDPAKEANNDLAIHIYDLYTEYKASEYRTNYLDKEVKDARKIYRQEREPKTFPWPDCSNKQIPLSAITVDNLEPRMAGMLYSDDNFISVKPVAPDDVPNIANVEREANWVACNIAKWKDAVNKAIHDVSIDGTIAVLPVFEEQVIVRRQRKIVTQEEIADNLSKSVPPDVLMAMMQEKNFPQNVDPEIMGGVPDYTEIKQNVTTIRLERVELKHVFVPDFSNDFDEEPTLRYVELNFDKVSKDKNYFGVTETMLSTEEVEKQQHDMVSATAEALKQKGSQYKKVIPAIEAYLKYDLGDGYGIDWVIATITINTRELIRKQRLVEVYWENRKPIHIIPLFPESNTPFGHGIPFIIRHVEKGMTDIYNQMIDSGTIQIVPWFFYQPYSGYDPDRMVIAPGKGIPVGNAEHIKFPNLSVSALAYLQFINFLLSMWERLVSINVMGFTQDPQTTNQGAESATGIQIMAQQGEIQHSYRGKTLQAAFGKLFKTVYALYVQTIPQDTRRRVFKDNEWQFEQVDIQGISGNYDFEFNLSPQEANSYFKRKSVLEFSRVIQPVMQFFNPIKMSEDICRAWDKYPVEEWMNPEIISMLKEHFGKKKAEQEAADMQSKEQKGLQRRTIHNQSDMSPEGGTVRVAEIDKQVREGAIRDNIKGTYGMDNSQ